VYRHFEQKMAYVIIIIMEKTEAGLERPLYPRNRCRYLEREIDVISVGRGVTNHRIAVSRWHATSDVIDV